MNLAWAKHWMGSFNREGLETAMDTYAYEVQFEDVTFAQKISGKAEPCHHAQDDVVQELGHIRKSQLTSVTKNTTSGAIGMAKRSKNRCGKGQ